MEIAWKDIEFSDRELIQGFYRQEKFRNCEFTFANNYLWAPYYEIRFAVIDGMLVFLSDESTFSVSFPIGTGNVKKTIEDLMRYFEEKGRRFRMHLVSPEQFDRLEQMFPGKFQIAYNPDAADYVYESEKLITLSGKKLHAKRNHVNKFKAEHPDWSYEPITDENTEECLAMAHRWREQNGCTDNPEKSNEFCVTLNALKMRKELGLKGGLIRADGEIVAFSLGEPCSDDCFVVHIEKAYADVQGAYPMINQQFVAHEASQYQYINREEDTGAEGLRKAKRSYHPVMMLQKGLVTLREAKAESAAIEAVQGDP